jgi:hypothetical protein
MAVIGRPFQKGNPGGPGRPKAFSEFREKARKAVDEHVLKRWISEVETMGEHWVKCSELLASYGYGKPVQPVEHGDNEGGPLNLTSTVIVLPPKDG